MQTDVRVLLIPMLILATAAVAAEPFEPKMLNGILVDPGGRALYTFGKDSAGKSTCYKQCAALWPPAYANADARPGGGYSLSTRNDGTKQWALQGKPLYYWAADIKPGQASGESVADWHLIRELPHP